MNHRELSTQVYLPAVYLRFAIQDIFASVALFKNRNLRVVSKAF
jgi:hypothetical protein